MVSGAVLKILCFLAASGGWFGGNGRGYVSGGGGGGGGGGGRWRVSEAPFGGRRLGDGGVVAGGALTPFSDPDLAALSNDLEVWMAQPEEGDLSQAPPRLQQILNALKDNGTYTQFYDHHLPDHSPHHSPKSNHNNNNSPSKESNHRKRQTQAEDHINTAQEIGAVDRIFQGESICGACSLLAKLVVGYLRLGAPVDFMANVLVKICYVVAYKSLPVCRGIIFQDKDRLAWIARNSEINGEEVCAMLLGDRGCGSFERRQWNVHLPPPPSPPPRKRPHRRPHHRRSLQPQPALVSSSSVRFDDLGMYVDEADRTTTDIHLSSTSSPSSTYSTSTSTSSTITTTLDAPSARRISSSSSSSSSSSNSHTSSGGKKKKDVLKVLHLTDPHYDPEYVAGSNAVCEAPLCCNRDSGTPSKEGHRAGRWGDYRNCDSPKWLIHHMFQHIVTNHPDIDYVVCTGDLVPHHIWKVSREGNLAVVREMADLVKGFFPNIPIYGSVGNHESFPRDSFPPPEVEEVWTKFGSQWLYDALSDNWSRLMGQPAPPSARYGGFYSVLARPGFRIISINTNYCYRLNWWVLYKDVDPGLMLSWLVRELSRAEQRGELVHIIGHIPPLYIDCYAQWGHQFDRVVSRFSHIIRGQFYGHSHKDDIRIHYDMADHSRAVGVEYITPNNGPFSNVNPSYRIFYIDGDHEETTRDVLDYETWVMNLTHANAFDAPHWYRLYTARRDLQLPSLHPRHWDRLTRRMVDQPQLLHKFRRYQVQDSDVELAKGCDLVCRQKILCNIVDGNRVKPSRCHPPP